MAGTKRKADASRSSSSVITEGMNFTLPARSPKPATKYCLDYSTQPPASTTAQGRGTRSSRSRAAAAAASAPSLTENNPVSSSKASASGSKEKTATETANKGPKEPHAKRQKLSPNLVEAPKPSRYSTRLKARANSPLSQELPPQLSPRQSPLGSAAVSTTQNVNDLTVKQDDVATHVPELTLTSSDSQQTSVESLTGPDAESQPQTKSEPASSLNAGLRSRKQKLQDSPTGNTSEDNSTEVSPKKLKLGEKGQNQEEAHLGSSNTHSATGSEEAQDAQSSEVASETVNSPLDQDKESAASQSIEEVDNTSSVQNENVSSSGTRGNGNRGRGSTRGRSTRGRGRGALARGSVRGKGRGGGRGGLKGGKRNEDDSDIEIERERSLSPSPATQKLNERQKELRQSWKRLAATQKLMLTALAGRTQQRLARDKNAHRKAPEYEEVQAALEEALRRREQILENEYRLRVEQADRLLEAQIKIINERYAANYANIREEHFYAARGEYMRMVEGVQHAEDDEHTEILTRKQPDVDGTVEAPVDVAKEESVEAVEVPKEVPAEVVAQAEEHINYEPLYLGEPRFQRGYNSKAVREISGSAAYELGKHSWDDFMQRAKMKEISQEESDPLQMLLQASAEAFEGEDGPLSSAATAPSQALSALADAASNARPAAAAASFRVPMPMPPAEQPPSFLLPRPSVSRPVLSGSHGLPNVFTTGGGLPQLPPPPGVAFTRPGPLSGFLPGQHQQTPLQQYQAPPPPPPPPPAASSSASIPAPYYFPGPPHTHTHSYAHAHAHQHQPPPPQTQPSGTPHRRY
ncbi:hypothetical protein UA08_02774 [Talaromyces atroroseus]|uniref:Uncharacterized protein n=1 Tax=Talaromyces atroroseus TaxID=1441469 RepID=A0A225AJJ6_TALAT|nr:hypothetical protein UA08_02774 [Talaromyces atroroseus]OKL61672.1 hypothetical protein UA08_02774 [Talaromyces atroroseus]